MSNKLEQIARDHGVQQRYQLIVHNRKTNQEKYINQWMSLEEVEDFLKRNEAQLTDSNVVGFPQTQTADHDTKIVIFKK